MAKKDSNSLILDCNSDPPSDARSSWRNNPKKIKIKVFDSLCRHCCSLLDGWTPYPCTVIAKHLGISVYKCRKAMRELVDEGLAERISCVFDPEESMLPYNGFTLTKKGMKTGIYRYNAKKEAEICVRFFGGTIDNYYIKEEI